MRRREFPMAGLSAAATARFAWSTEPGTAKGVMLMDRIAPSASTLYICDADGANERPFLAESSFDYHASFSADGNRVVFTSERNGDGQSDIFRCRPDGTGIEPLVAGTAMDDAGALSPDGRTLACVSTEGSHIANIRLLDIASGKARDLTGSAAPAGDPDESDSHFRPSWSPDGRWIAFSSDRDTLWRGHDEGHGWEHTQELGVYVIRPDGSDLRRLTTSGADDAHAVWTADGRLLRSSGMYGFRDEAALHDDTFQPYGQIMAMNSDGSDKRLLADSLWEDSMPLFIPRAKAG